MQPEQMNEALIGENKGDDAQIFDVGTSDFEEKVMAASIEKPILVEFWAPWCGPCKQLMPVLEQEVMAVGDKIALAKINIDQSPELAQAMQVQSVPAVFAFFGGQPVTGFMGVRPASEIKSLIGKLLEMARQAQPDALDIPVALKEAADALAAGDVSQAQGIYVHILQEDENNTEAYSGMVRSFIAGGDIEAAKELIEDVPEKVKNDKAFEAALKAVALAETKPSGNGAELQEKVLADPDNHQARFDLAMALFSAGQKTDAIDALIEIIRRDREWEEDKARKQLLEFFEALGFSDPDAVAGRKKLSSVLFS